MIAIKHMLKNMFSHRTRLILTVLAIAWGTFSITTMLAVGEGLRMTFGNVVKNSGDGALIVSGRQSTEPYRGQAAGIKVIFGKEDLVRLQEAFQNRAEIAGEAQWTVSLFRKGKSKLNTPVIAVDPNYRSIHGVSLLPRGRFINALDDAGHRQVIVLGARTVKKLFNSSENPLGQIVYLASKPFLVVGVQKQTLQLLSTSSVPDDFTNWIPYSTYSELTQDHTYSDFIVAPKDLSEVPRLQQEIINSIAHSRQLNPLDSGILDFTNLQKEKIKLNTFFYSIEFILGVIGTLTLVVAGVGIANVTYISIKRATREIGIRMALGATTYDILFYYACEALLTTALGGIVGLVMAKGFVGLINLIPAKSEVLQEIGNPRPILSFTVMMVVISILGLIGFLSGLFPARKAAWINPAEALRHD